MTQKVKDADADSNTRLCLLFRVPGHVDYKVISIKYLNRVKIDIISIFTVGHMV